MISSFFEKLKNLFFCKNKKRPRSYDLDDEYMFNYKKRRIFYQNQDSSIVNYEKRTLNGNPIDEKNLYRVSPQTYIIFAKKAPERRLSNFSNKHSDKQNLWSHQINVETNIFKNEIHSEKSHHYIEKKQDMQVEEERMIYKPQEYALISENLEDIEHQNLDKSLNCSESIVNLLDEKSVKEKQSEISYQLEKIDSDNDSLKLKEDEIFEEYELLTKKISQPFSFEQFFKLKQ